MNASLPHVHVYREATGLNCAVADAVAEHAARAVSDRGRFSLVLAGGSTPRRLYRLLATDYLDVIPWKETHVFWGDERFVPPTDAANNYRMARMTLLDHVPLPAAQIHPVDTLAPSPARAAEAYDALLEHFFEGGPPAFDLVLLGLGEDGHTASLFPENEPWDTNGGPPWVQAVVGPDRAQPRRRVTLTLPALNAARHVFVLVAGTAKSNALRTVLDRAPGHDRLPAAHVSPTAAVTWFVDEDAWGTTATSDGER